MTRTGLRNREICQQQQEALQATYQFVVIGLKKNGTPYKVTPEDIRVNGVRTREQTENRQRQLIAMNGGKQFVILPL
jgi:hypothetical protein